MLLGVMFIKLLFHIKLCILFWCCYAECKYYFFTYLYGFMFQKTLCFTSQMFYGSNIPIHSYTINKIIFIITTITIIIIIIIFNFNITIIIVIIIIAIIKSTIVIIIILSFVLHFFDIKICVSPSQHLNYCHKVALQWFPEQSEVCSLLQAKNFFDFFSILGCKVWVTSIFLFPS